MTEEKKRPSNDFHCDEEEKKTVEAFLKANCGLEDTEPGNIPNQEYEI